MKEFERQRKLANIIVHDKMNMPTSQVLSETYDFNADDSKDTKNLKTIQR